MSHFGCTVDKKPHFATRANTHRFWRFHSAGRSPPLGGRSLTRIWCEVRGPMIWWGLGRCCCSVSPASQLTPSFHRGSLRSHTCIRHEYILMNAFNSGILWLIDNNCVHNYPEIWFLKYHTFTNVQSQPTLLSICNSTYVRRRYFVTEMKWFIYS